MAPRETRGVKALLVVPRLPGTGHTGDRLRAGIHAAALAEAGYEVDIASAPAPGFLAAGLGVARALVSGEPLQSALFSGDWRGALSGAARGAGLLVILLPQRLPAAARALLPAGPAIVDYVDALGFAARQAASADPAAWRRLYWRFEAPRLERAEREASGRAAILVATTRADAAHLPEGTEAVPNGVEILPLAGRAREPVVAFTGRLRYRPNELAAQTLLSETWPLVRQAVPSAELRLGGADAPAHLLRRHGRDGVTVTSPVADMPAFLREARIAAVPVDLGSGTPNKLFEAFEAGCAVVGTPAALARAADGVSAVPGRAAASPAEAAAAIVDYLNRPETAAADGRAGRAWVEAHADRRRARGALASLYARAREGRA
jgi:glycosyltransferase involved in cell wall biosynthesis